MVMEQISLDKAKEIAKEEGSQAGPCKGNERDSVHKGKQRPPRDRLMGRL